MQPMQVQQLFSEKIRQLLTEAEIDYNSLYEIRLRAGRPVFLVYDGGERFLSQPGGEPYLVTREDLTRTLELASGYSLYAYEE